MTDKEILKHYANSLPPTPRMEHQGTRGGPLEYLENDYDMQSPPRAGSRGPLE